jgi:aminopeptidase N
LTRSGWSSLWRSLLLALAIGWPLAARAAAPDAYADVLPDLRATISAETAERLSDYRLEATLDPATSAIAGEAAVTYHNTAATPLDEIYFRLYPNAGYYGEGALTIDAASAAGTAVTPVLEVDDTALRVDLPAPLAPGETVAIELDFTTTVPTDSTGSYGIFTRDSAEGTWILADWHPVLAVYEDDLGWVIDPATSFGDPTYAASSLYDVTITAPPDLTVVASGLAVAAAERDGLVAHHYVAGPAREFTLVVDDDYEAVSTEVDGTTITVYTEPELAATVAGEATLDAAAAALTVFGERFGPYPFAELDLVQARLNGALAVSWSGIIFLDGPALLGGFAVGDPVGFETVVAHEVAHLWWGGSVGSDSNKHGFINEGLATVSSLLYLEWTAGEAAAAAELQAWVVGPARALLRRGDAVVDLPIAEGQDPDARAWATYAKASLGFLAIRQQVGDEAFIAGLARYADRFAFGIAEPVDLRRAFEQASGQDLTELWRHWFDAAEMTGEEIRDLAA